MSKRLARQAQQYAVSSGPSIREMIQEDLDDAVDELMAIKEKGFEYLDSKGINYPEAKGYAYGLARALAILTNPYDFEQALVAVRAEAMERWQARETLGNSLESVALAREV
jgi:hypothetical protein